MRDSIKLDSLKELSLSVASSCDLQYFVNHVRKVGCFSSVSYNFESGSSDDASIEILIPDTPLGKADVIVSSVAETSKKLIHPLVNGRTDLDFESLFERLKSSLESVIAYMQSSNAKACFIFKYPINKFKFDLNDRPWDYGSITYWLNRIEQLYIDLLAKDDSDRIDFLDLTDVLIPVGMGERYFRNEFWGGHPEGAGAVRLAEDFIERVISRVDHQQKIKAIALDLDNTLWDGVFLESDAPPRIFGNRATALMHHVKKGIPICVVSKNNPEDEGRISEIIYDAVPGLSRAIISYYIGWGPKSDSIRSMASALGIGTGAIAFFDDNEFERGEVLYSLPDVRVYTEQELESSLRYGEFSFPRLSSDAVRRVESYRQNVERAVNEKISTSGDLTEYLHSLEFKIEFSRAKSGDIDRVDELVQRTNQQNLLLARTDRRVISKYIDEERVVLISLSDRFGDYGTIGAIVYDVNGSDVSLVEMAISCRALGKGVEECIIVFIDRFFGAGKTVSFVAVKTYRNESFFRKMIDFGFSYEESSSVMSISLSGDRSYPEWFDVNSFECGSASFLGAEVDQSSVAPKVISGSDFFEAAGILFEMSAIEVGYEERTVSDGKVAYVKRFQLTSRDIDSERVIKDSLRRAGYRVSVSSGDTGSVKIVGRSDVRRLSVILRPGFGEMSTVSIFWG